VCFGLGISDDPPFFGLTKLFDDGRKEVGSVSKRRRRAEVQQLASEFVNSGMRRTDFAEVGVGASHTESASEKQFIDSNDGSLARRPSSGPMRSPDTNESRVSPLIGNVKQNLAPRGAQPPPCNSTMERPVDNPMLLP
jgi:hypothetical protein